MGDMNNKRLAFQVGAVCLALCGGWAHADEGSGWFGRAAVEQMRMSAVLDGDLLDDDKSAVRHAHGAVNSWARAGARLEAGSEDANGVVLQWSAFLDSQVHVKGSGAATAARLNNRVPGAPGQTYPFDFTSVKFGRKGVGVQRSGLVSAGGGQMRWTLGANAFAVDEYKSVDAAGVLSDGNNGALGLQATVREDEMGRQSPFVRPVKVLGWGVSLDAALEGGSADALQWRLAVKDLGPSVRLKNLLGNDRSIDTNTVSFDADGYVQFAPAISGRYSQRSAQLKMEPEWFAAAALALDGGRRLEGAVLWHGVRKELSVGHEWSAQGYRLAMSGHVLRDMPASLSVRVAGPFWSVAWRADRLKPGKARIWGLSADVRF